MIPLLIAILCVVSKINCASIIMKYQVNELDEAEIIEIFQNLALPVVSISHFGNEKKNSEKDSDFSDEKINQLAFGIQKNAENKPVWNILDHKVGYWIHPHSSSHCNQETGKSNMDSDSEPSTDQLTGFNEQNESPRKNNLKDISEEELWSKFLNSLLNENEFNDIEIDNKKTEYKHHSVESIPGNTDSSINDSDYFDTPLIDSSPSIGYYKHKETSIMDNFENSEFELNLDNDYLKNLLYDSSEWKEISSLQEPIKQSSDINLSDLSKIDKILKENFFTSDEKNRNSALIDSDYFDSISDTTSTIYDSTSTTKKTTQAAVYTEELENGEYIDDLSNLADEKGDQEFDSDGPMEDSENKTIFSDGNKTPIITSLKGERPEIPEKQVSGSIDWMLKLFDKKELKRSF